MNKNMMNITYIVFLVLCIGLIVVEIDPSITGFAVDDGPCPDGDFCTCQKAVGETIVVKPSPISTNYLGTAITIVLMIAGTMLYYGLRSK